jgi:hypothetical protein
MPNSQEHQAKAERNRAFVDRIKASVENADWVAISAFYAAVHLVERLCATDNKHHVSHNARLAWVYRHRRHQTIHTAFSVLYDASRIARYGTINQFDKAFPGDTVQKILVDVHLVRIETYVTAYFSPPSF